MGRDFFLLYMCCSLSYKRGTSIQDALPVAGDTIEWSSHTFYHLPKRPQRGKKTEPDCALRATSQFDPIRWSICSVGTGIRYGLLCHLEPLSCVCSMRLLHRMHSCDEEVRDGVMCTIHGPWT